MCRIYVARWGIEILQQANSVELGRYTALHLAAKVGQINMVTYLSSQGVDVNAVNVLGQTPLYLAALKATEQHNKVLEFLVNMNADINKATNTGTTPLAKAAKAGNLAMVQLLAEKGARTNSMDVFHLRPVHHAARGGHVEVLKFLVLEKHEAVNEAVDNGGFTPLHYAANENHNDCCEFLVEVARADAEIADSLGSRPIEYAANAGHLEVVMLLSRHVKDIDRPTDTVGVTPLFLAAREGRLSTVMFLIENGADPHKPNMKEGGPNFGKTPISIREEFDKKDEKASLVTLFFRLKSLPADATDEIVNLLRENDFALWFAMVGAPFTSSYVRKLLEQFPTELVNATSASTGRTPLHVYAENSNADMVLFLLNHGCNRQAKDHQGKSFVGLMSDAFKVAFVAQGDVSKEELEDANNHLWFHVAKQDGDLVVSEVFNTILGKVANFVAEHPDLAVAKDENGRIAIEMASQPVRSAMQSVLFWHGKYEIAERIPDYVSATCFVFKATDVQTIDPDTHQPTKVALKLTKQKSSFDRENAIRRVGAGFSAEFVMPVHASYSPAGGQEEVSDIRVDGNGQLNKENAEKMYMTVMPRADRNIWTSMKQENWAGRNMEAVRHVFTQLSHCVEELHRQGVLHGDVKPLNIVRVGAQWKLIDLDAACAIGVEPVGHKSSSAYAPPEAIYVDEAAGTACVRSVAAVQRGDTSYDLLTAHPSFDVWSLGCVLFQMCNTDVVPLFQGNQEDNLTDDASKEDNLFALAGWTQDNKERKLRRVADPLARNLLSQMLHREPSKRPLLSRVLAHPFVSGKKVARLTGEEPKYDVFLSYRVASDSHHVEKLYHLLTAQGFKVYWDKLCLEPGVDWEEGFCAGLVNSQAFVPLLSRDAINHPDKDWQNFSKLTADAKCDNVFLEHRLAIELQGLGLIEKVFPVFIGDVNATTGEYGNYFGGGCHPSLPAVSVRAVEEKLHHHMESQALGTPLEVDRTVASVVTALTACQGAFIQGPAEATFATAADSIAKMLSSATDTADTADNTDNPTQKVPLSTDPPEHPQPSTASPALLAPKPSALHVTKVLVEAKDNEIKDLTRELESLRATLGMVVGELKGGLQTEEIQAGLVQRIEALGLLH